MQEHPIPQDITNYRFHIIGSMTLKQFGEVFLGVIIAGIIYSTNLIVIVKWPLILLSVGIGAAAAFLPIEERPLDHWIITFFKVLYKPTKFYWKRMSHIPDPFMFKPRTDNSKQEPTLDLTPVKHQRIKDYISAVPEKASQSQDFTEQELLRMQEIMGAFTSVEVTQKDIKKTTPNSEKPRIDIRVRKMRKPVLQEEIIFSDSSDNLIEKEETATIIEGNTPVENLQNINKIVLKTDQVAQDVSIPEEKLIKASQKKETSQKKSIQEASQSAVNNSYMENEPQNTVKNQATKDASYNSDLPFPIKPTEPNKVVGMVLSQGNDLLSNAIVEIQTLEGNIVRAVKTNALGQFFITTPLKSGDYNIIIDKDGYQFQPQHLKINDSILSPIEIKSDN